MFYWVDWQTFSASQMSPFSMNGMPSPGYQCPTSVYQPAPQQVYSLTQTGQQVQNSANKVPCSCFFVGKLVKMNEGKA